MKIIADTHCHTIASTHAYSTIEEVISAAAQKDLFAVAITDHGCSMPGAPLRFYFEHMIAIPDYVKGVRVLRGVETNIVGYDGRLDIADSTLKRLDWVIASMHDITLAPCHDIERNTQAWLEVAKNPHVQVIGHCGMPAFAFDYERVIPEFGRLGKLVEINANTFLVRKKSIQNCKKIAELCKKHRVSVVVNSDAHFSSSVGEVDAPLQLLREIDFPEELIINSEVNRFVRYLKSCGIRI